MSTRFSDISFDTDVYASYLAEQSIIPNAFAESGVTTQNALLSQKAKTTEQLVFIPAWQELDASSVNHSTDDPDSYASPGKITSVEMAARVANLNYGWAVADLVAEMLSDSPMQAIASRTTKYWQTIFQRRLIAMLNGVLADNEANDGGDMLYDVSVDTVGALDAANLISGEVVIEGSHTLGDMAEQLQVLAVHSAVYKRLRLQDLIEYERPSGAAPFATYAGYRLVVDDTLPKVTGTNQVSYVSVLLGAGAIGVGEGRPKVPVEIDRDVKAGDGGGFESLWERKTWLVVPYGFSYSDSVVTEAELAKAASWNRVYARKAVPLAFIRTNG